MLEISHLSKRFGEVRAVHDVSFTVPRGRIVGFVGPNGAGKSTTMRSVFGLVEPDAGSITWNGAPVDSTSTARFGYMPEQRGLYPKMKVAEQVRFFAQLKMIPKGVADANAHELLARLGLEDRVDDQLEKLSHGNQQRVQLAVALANDPELMILDEPFNGLDPVAVNTLQEVLEERVAAGTGVLFSSHQLELVERLCDEVVMITEGEIRARGTVAGVRAQAGLRYVDIEVDRPIMPLTDALLGVDIVRSETSTATVSVLSDQDLDGLLAAARSAGTVTRFSFDLPPLADVFVEIAGRQGAVQEEVSV